MDADSRRNGWKEYQDVLFTVQEIGEERIGQERLLD